MDVHVDVLVTLCHNFLYVHVYVVCLHVYTYHGTMVHVYLVRATLSPKRLEIQPLRLVGGATGKLVGVVSIRHHGILPWYQNVVRFQLDSDVCSADLHHNPRKHVDLHAHQRLPPLGRSQWPSASASSTCTYDWHHNGTIMVRTVHVRVRTIWYHGTRVPIRVA